MRSCLPILWIEAYLLSLSCYSSFLSWTIMNLFLMGTIKWTSQPQILIYSSQSSTNIISPLLAFCTSWIRNVLPDTIQRFSKQFAEFISQQTFLINSSYILLNIKVLVTYHIFFSLRSFLPIVQTLKIRCNLKIYLALEHWGFGKLISSMCFAWWEYKDQFRIVFSGSFQSLTEPMSSCKCKFLYFI